MNSKMSIRFTMLFLLMLCFILFLQVACTAGSPSLDPELEKLQGHWKSDGERKTEITITGDSLYFYERPDFWYKATIVLSSDVEPLQMRATITGSAPPVKDVGEVVSAIYKFEDGILTLAAGGSDPPAAFADVTDPYILKKVQSEKK